jgi:glycosyltransferase involved in cell wall biosynthesis
MVEVIGDPLESVREFGRGPFYFLGARVAARHLAESVRHADLGTYVTNVGLPDRYPLPMGCPRDFVSSIRLASSFLSEPRQHIAIPEPLRVILVAGLQGYKRHQDLIRACGMAIEKGVRIDLHLVGDGPCRKEITKLCKDLNLSRYVTLHGQIVDRDDLCGLLDKSHLFAMSSSAAEGLPRAMIEAMARGLPVVGTRANGITRLARPEELVDIGDISALAELIVSVSRDPERMNAMSRHSIHMARQYTIDQLSPRRQNMYRTLREASESQTPTAV